MDVNQQLASVRSDVDKVSKKTIDELNKVAAEGLQTVQNVAAGVEKVQGKVAADAKSVVLTPTELGLILGGIELASVRQRKRYRRTA